MLMSSFNAAAESLDSTPPPAATRRLRNSAKTTNGPDAAAVSVTNDAAAEPVDKNTATKDNNNKNISLNLSGFGRQQGVLTPSPENHITDHEMPDLSEPRNTAAHLEADTNNSNNNKNCSNSDDEDMVSTK